MGPPQRERAAVPAVYRAGAPSGVALIAVPDAAPTRQAGGRCASLGATVSAWLAPAAFLARSGHRRQVAPLSPCDTLGPESCRHLSLCKKGRVLASETDLL